jgi:putative NADH-flavin reductase
MKLTILGATGGVGSELVRQAVERGQDVTAVVRSPEKLGADVRYVRAGFADADRDALASALVGAEAVLSALGARSKADSGIVTRATGLVVPLMREAGARRLIVVSAVPVPTVPSPARPNPPKNDPDEGFVMNRILTPIIRKAFWGSYVDLAQMEDLVRASELDWTIVRPPRLLTKPLTGRYRTAVGGNVRGGRSVSRANVAHFMLTALDRPDVVSQAVGIAE